MKFLSINKYFFSCVLGIASIGLTVAPVLYAADVVDPLKVYEDEMSLHIGGFFDKCDARYIKGQRPADGEARIAEQSVLDSLIVDSAEGLLAFYAREVQENCSAVAEDCEQDWPQGSKNRNLYKAILEELTHFIGWAKPSLVKFYGKDFALGMDKADPISTLLKKLVDAEPRLGMKRKADDTKNRIESLMEKLTQQLASVEERHSGGGFRRGGFRTGAPAPEHSSDDRHEENSFNGAMVINAEDGAQIAVVFKDGSKGFARIDGGEFTYDIAGEKKQSPALGVSTPSNVDATVLKALLEDQKALKLRLQGLHQQTPVVVYGVGGALSSAAVVMVAAEILPAMVTDVALAGQIFTTLCQDPRVYMLVGACGLGFMLLVKAKRAVLG